MDRPCTYCGKDASEVGSLYANRITGHYAEACPKHSKLLEGECGMWVGLQLRTFAIPEVRQYVIRKCLSSLTTEQLERLVNHTGGMCLRGSQHWEDEDKRDVWERDWDPLTIAFGIERLKQLCREGGVGGPIGYDDVMEEDGYSPKGNIDGHHTSYAFGSSTPKEVKRMAAAVLKGRA